MQSIFNLARTASSVLLLDGCTATSALEYGLRPLTGGGPGLQATFLAGSFVESLPTNSSRYTSHFYEQAKEIEQAYASYRDALRQGDMGKAKGIMESDRDKLIQHDKVAFIKKQMSELNSQARMMSVNKMMPPDVKRDWLNEIFRTRNQLA